MAKVFLVKDGPRGDTTNEGWTLSVQELTNRLVNHECRYLGTDPPTFNATSPSSDYQHVVVEVGVVEKNEQFPEKGFYVVEDLTASQAAFLCESDSENGNEL